MSTLRSEFCTVQVLAGPQNLSALWNSSVSAFQRAVKFVQNANLIRIATFCPV